MIERAHGRLDVFQAFFQFLDGLDDVETLPGAGRTTDDIDAAVAQAQGFKDLESDLNLFLRVRRQRHPHRVADPHPKQLAQTDGRFDGPGRAPSGLVMPRWIGASV